MYHLSWSQETHLLRQAIDAHNRVDLKESQRLYKQILAESDLSQQSRANAHQNLGIQRLRFYKDPASAITHYHSALATGISKVRSYQLLAQLYLEVQNFDSAIHYASTALTESRGSSDTVASGLLNAAVLHDEAVFSAQHKGSIDKSKLLKAHKLLQIVLNLQPGLPRAYELLAGITLLQQNGPELLAALRNYYYINSSNPANEVLAPAFAALEKILLTYRGQKLIPRQRYTLMKALAGARFHHLAILVSQSPVFGPPIQLPNGPKDLKDLYLFAAFSDSVQSINNEFYPRIARGEKNYDSTYASDIRRQLKRLWGESGQPFAWYSDSACFRLLEQRFGALGYMGNTNGFYSVVIGMIVQNDIKEVDQYGYRSPFQYTVITRMVSQDFTTWYGSGNVGGWGTDSSMVQIRDAYIRGPFDRLAWVTDTTAARRIRDRIITLKNQDLETCKLNKYAQPRFLSLSIRYHAARHLLHSLRSDSTLTLAEVSSKFVAETMRLNVESTVFAHEGRHAIDQRFVKSWFDTASHADREFTAKLSEVAFSSDPMLALTGSILGTTLPETTPHGAANARFIRTLVDWMEVHADEIQGLNKAIPMVMQIELLTDDQLRKICRNADPLLK